MERKVGLMIAINQRFVELWCVTVRNTNRPMGGAAYGESLLLLLIQITIVIVIVIVICLPTEH